jgi:hypothetical protein
MRVAGSKLRIIAGGFVATCGIRKRLGLMKRGNSFSMPSTTESALHDPRQKKDRACDACRRRKTKCDGPLMPQHVCTNCIQTRKECTYVSVRAKFNHIITYSFCPQRGVQTPWSPQSVRVYVSTRGLCWSHAPKVILQDWRIA